MMNENNNAPKMNNTLEFTFDELLNQLDKQLETRTKKVKVPISLKEFIVKPIITSDETEIKSLNITNVFKIVLKLYELIIKKSQPVNQSTNLLFEQIANEISHHDILVLAKTLLEISYDTFKTFDINIAIECPICKTVHNHIDINNANIKYEDFKIEVSNWDKDIPFTEYSIPYTDKEIIIKQDNYNIYIIPILYLGIPTLKKVIDAEKYISEYERKKQTELTLFNPRSISNNIERTIQDISTNKRDIVFGLTKKINFYAIPINVLDIANIDGKDVLDIIEQQKDKIVHSYEITDPLKILTILDKFPVSTHEKILEITAEEFNKYIPMFTTDKLKCKECGTNIEIMLNPIYNLLDRLVLS